MKLRVFTNFAPMMALCVALGATGVVSASYAQTAPATGSESQETRVQLVFSGGYETDPRDGGRPVALVAGALGVPSEVFREVFRQVRPARGGPPQPEQVRQNKAVLMNGLGKYGVTNERLDVVSNYYRYVPGRGNRWPTRPATGYAVVERGVVTRYVITDGGSGYCAPPTVTVPGYPDATAKVQLAFGPRFERNGSVSSVTVAPSGK